MQLKRNVLRWLARWRRARDAKHRSNWDRGDVDVLDTLIQNDRLRKRRHLP